ncbi:hypothetical protein [Pantoea vagans]|nr:hypothetical protein [Pantoea vagans]
MNRRHPPYWHIMLMSATDDALKTVLADNHHQRAALGNPAMDKP